MKTPKSGKSSVLTGCLVAFGIFVVLCGVGGYILYRNVSSVVQDAVKEFDKEFKAEEDKLRTTPAEAVKMAKLAEIVSAFKAKPAEAKKTYDGQIYRISAVLSSKDNLASAMPLKLPVDFLMLQGAAGAVPDKNLTLCLYSSAQKARFDALKAQQALTVLAKLELDEADGSIMLSPCIIE